MRACSRATGSFGCAVREAIGGSSKSNAQATAGAKVSDLHSGMRGYRSSVTRAFSFDGEGDAITAVAFTADGKQVCNILDPLKAECTWDAGAEVRPHVFRVVANLIGGGRIVAAGGTQIVSGTAGFTNCEFVNPAGKTTRMTLAPSASANVEHVDPSHVGQLAYRRQ